MGQSGGLLHSNVPPEISLDISLSREFLRVDTAQLPSFLPAQQPPQVEEHMVYERIKKLKKSPSTLPLDLPNKLRQACAVELAEPVMILLILA